MNLASYLPANHQPNNKLYEIEIKELKEQIFKLEEQLNSIAKKEEEKDLETELMALNKQLEERTGEIFLL